MFLIILLFILRPLWISPPQIRSYCYMQHAMYDTVLSGGESTFLKCVSVSLSVYVSN